MTISKLINNLLIVITMLAFISQFFIDLSTVNIASSMIILLSAFITIFYFRWSSALETNPLSSFAILGFCFTTTIGALWIQSFAWTAVAENLRQPLVTLSWLTLFQAISIVAHCVYRLKANSVIIQKPGILKRLFNWMGVYDTPKVEILWVVGVFGLFCVLLARIFPVANGFSYLAWSPFLIPVYYYNEGKNYCNIKANIVYLAMHSSLIILLGMFFNARGMLFLAPVTLSSVLILQLMRSRKRLDSRVLFRAVIAILIAIAISIPAANLATAMAIARDGRDKVSPFVIISNTIENFNSPEKLKDYQEQEERQTAHSIYDEYYVANSLGARFVNTKRHDNAIYFAGKLSDSSAKEVLRMSGDFLWGTLPQPFLDALKIDMDKRYLAVSIGDVLAHYAVGTPLGGLRTGSMFGQGLVLFGYFSLLIYFAMCFILFAAIDIFSKRTADGAVVISVIGMLSLWGNFVFGITGDSFHHLFMGVVRGVMQSAFLYFIAISFAKFLTKSFSLKTSSNKYSSNNKLIG